MKKKAIPPFTLTAGQSGRLLFNFTLPEGAEMPALRGALMVQGQRVDMENTQADMLTIPALPAGVYLTEVRAAGVCVLYGHVEVLPSPLFGEEGEATCRVDVDNTADVLQVSVTLNAGPQGEKGADGGYYMPTMSDDYVLSWVPSKEGMPETGTAPFRGPQGEQGPQGEPGESVTLDATPTSGSANGVTSGGIYDADLHVSLGTGSMAVGKNAVANNAYSVAMGEGAVTGGYYNNNSPTATLTTVSTNRTSTSIWSYPCFSTAVGYHATAARGACTAYGAYARAGSEGSTSSGSNATASGSNATASGNGATASGSRMLRG